MGHLQENFTDVKKKTSYSLNYRRGLKQQESYNGGRCEGPYNEGTRRQHG